MCFLEIDLNPRHGVVSKLCGGGRSHRRSCCLQIPSVGSHHHHHLPLFSSCKSDNNNSRNPDTPQRPPRKKKCGHWFSEKILQPSQRFNSSWNQLWWEESAFFPPFSRAVCAKIDFLLTAHIYWGSEGKILQCVVKIFNTRLCSLLHAINLHWATHMEASLFYGTLSNCYPKHNITRIKNVHSCVRANAFYF